MMGLLAFAATRMADRAARASLDGLIAAVGVSGLTAARHCPSLLATVDQHAAAIRDGLKVDARPLTPVVLAAYAEGVRDTALRHGWRPPRGGISWRDADWVLHRLLAASVLAQSLRRRQR